MEPYCTTLDKLGGIICRALIYLDRRLLRWLSFSSFDLKSNQEATAFFFRDVPSIKTFEIPFNFFDAMPRSCNAEIMRLLRKLSGIISCNICLPLLQGFYSFFLKTIYQKNHKTKNLILIPRVKS